MFRLTVFLAMVIAAMSCSLNLEKTSAAVFKPGGDLDESGNERSLDITNKGRGIVVKCHDTELMYSNKSNKKGSSDVVVVGKRTPPFEPKDASHFLVVFQKSRYNFKNYGARKIFIWCQESKDNTSSDFITALNNLIGCFNGAPSKKEQVMPKKILKKMKLEFGRNLMAYQLDKRDNEHLLDVKFEIFKFADDDNIVIIDIQNSGKKLFFGNEEDNKKFVGHVVNAISQRGVFIIFITDRTLVEYKSTKDDIKKYLIPKHPKLHYFPLLTSSRDPYGVDTVNQNQELINFLLNLFSTTGDNMVLCALTFMEDRASSFVDGGIAKTRIIQKSTDGKGIDIIDNGNQNRTNLNVFVDNLPGLAMKPYHPLF